MTLAWLVVAGVAITTVSVLARRRDALWPIDPRAVLAVVLLLNACGFAAYQLATGEGPAVFGLDERLVVSATFLLVSGQAGFLIGTVIPTGRLARRLPRLAVSPADLGQFITLLTVAVVATGAAQYGRLAVRGFDAIFQQRYGATQWDLADSVPALFNIGFICVPTLLVLLVAWGMAGRSLASRKLWLLTAFAVLPSLLIGTRRDTILCIFGFVFARALQGARMRLRQAAIVGLVALSVLYVLGLSRSGESLGFGDRIAAVRERTGEESFVVRTITMTSGTAVLTAAMNVFPRWQPYAGGRTYLEAAANVVTPRFLTGGYAFTPAGVAFRDLYYADVTSYGMDYSLAAEAFQNFGRIGPFMVSLVAGVFLMLLFRLAMANRASLWTFLHIHALACAFWAVRTDSNTALKTLVYGWIWLLGVWAVSKVLRRRRVVVRADRITRRPLVPSASPAAGGREIGPHRAV